MAANENSWAKPAAKAIPRKAISNSSGAATGPLPETPACYGFSIIAKVKEGREEAVRAYGKTDRGGDRGESGGSWRR